MATPLIDTQLDDLQEILSDISAKKEDGKFTDQAAVRKLVQEAEELLQQMNVEVHTITNKQRKTDVQNKIKGFRQIIDEHKHTLLVSGGKSRVPITDSEAQQQDSLDKLKAARQQLTDTEAVGTDTLGHLAVQRDTIQKGRANTKEIRAEMGRSSNLITKMSKWWRG